MSERLDDYRQCFNWAEQAIYNLHEGFANHDSNMGELLTALGVGHYLMGEQAEVEWVAETPFMRENPNARFTLLTSLAQAGDRSVLPEARRAMFTASEQSTYLDDVIPGLDFGGIRSAEKLARLVSVGDKDLVDIARKAAGNVMVKHRSTQFVDLYYAGDRQSLALACEAAEAAYAEDALLGYDHNSGIATRNLHAVLDHALQNGDFEDAVEVTKRFKDEGDITEALAKRFAAGDESILAELEERLPKDGYIRRRCVVHMARANYGPAVKEIKQRAEKAEKRLYGSAWRRAFKSRDAHTERYQLYDDLTILHSLGDETAVKRAIKLARSDKDFHYSYGFGDVGADVLELANIAYENDPGILTRLRLLELDFSPGLFRDQLVDEIGRLQGSGFSWLGQLVVLTARKASEDPAFK